MTKQPTQIEHPPSDPRDETRRKFAIRINLVTGLLLFGVSVPSLITLTPEISLQYVGNTITAVMALISFVSAWVSYRYSPTRGSILFIVAILLVSLGIPIYANGLGLQAGLIVAIIVAGIAATTLRPLQAARASVAALIVEILVILLDLYLPDFGLETYNSPYINPFLILISIVFGFFVSRQFNSYTLRTKLVIAFTLVTITPLSILGIYSNTISRALITENARQDLSETSRQIGAQIDSYLTIQKANISIEAQQPAMRAYLELTPDQRAGSAQEASAIQVLSIFIRKSPGIIHSYALLDLQGSNLIDTLDEQQNRKEDQHDYFKQPIESGASFASSLIFNSEDDPYIYFSAPVRNDAGDIIGVLRAEYNPAIFQNILLASLPSQETGHLFALIDSETFVRIGYTGDTSNLYKSFKIFDPQEFAALQRQNRLRRNAPIDVEPQNQLATNLENLSQTPFFTNNPDPNTSFDNALTTGTELDSIAWILMVSRQEAILFAPAEEQTRTTILLSMAMLAFAALAGYIASQVLTRPIISLASVTEKIAGGDLNARAQVRTQDEIGALADSFNRMTSQLQDTLGGLERRIAERTADVELARQQTEKRAQELQTISEISRLISTEQRLDILLPLITRLISERFDFYHVGIFLIDNARQFAVLQAANSEGGRRMLERGHKLEVGQTGIVGNVAQTGKPRIALDVGSDAVYFDNPDLPNTRSEMALPLNLRSRTVGILDVQSLKAGAFTESDANTLNILADQVAITIDNAYLFEQSQQALNEVQSLYRQYQAQEWQSFTKQEAKIGYHQFLIGGKPIEIPVESDEIQEAMEKGKILVTNAAQSDTEPSIVVPVKLRGQTIGVLNIKAPSKNRQWNQDEINLAQAISDRLALALENARLLQESQRRAVKEQKIGDVTAKIGASINMRNVLQTAVEELGRALPGSEVVIQFQSDQDNGSK